MSRSIIGSRRRRGARAIGATLTFLAIGGTAAGEPAPDAELLARVRATYQDIESLDATFEQRNAWEILDPEGVYLGRLRLLVDGRLRIEYEEPPGHLLVSDGEWVWTYVPENGQVLKSPARGTRDALGRLFLDFLAGQRVVAVKPLGGGRAEIEIEPAESLALARLYVTVDTRTGFGDAYAWVDREGNRAEYRFLTSRANVALPESLFAFQPPDGVDVIELDSEGR